MTATDTATTSVSVDTMVDAPVEHAFRVFTEGIGSWWDPEHHLFEGTIDAMTFEPRVGGRIVDRYDDGRECAWARVLAYDPPARVVFSWDISTEWKHSTDYDKSSEVEVTFAAVDLERTHVVLTHRHIDRHGAGWEKMRDALGQGWSLASFASAASAHAD